VKEPGTQTNVELLGLTQEYLRCELQRVAPDSLLVTAWDEFYWIYSGLLRRFAVAQGLRGTDVDDCLQEVWMEVARSLNGFERPQDRSGLRAWLYAVVRSKANDLFRRTARRREESLEQARAEGLEPLCPAIDPISLSHEQWERTLLETTVETLRSELSKTNAGLLQMRILEQRDVAEVAVALRISPEQVWYRQYRLLKKLRARMAVFAGDPLNYVDVATHETQGLCENSTEFFPDGILRRGQNSPKKNENFAPGQLVGSVS
jgi:RNA polymerase sigma factor (sigma-70 family)